VTDTDPVPAAAFPNNTVRIVELPEPSVTPAVVNTSFPKRPLNSNVPLSNVTGAVPTPFATVSNLVLSSESVAPGPTCTADKPVNRPPFSTDNVPPNTRTAPVIPLSPANANDPVPTFVKETAPPSDPANVVVAALATVSSAGETERIAPPIPVNVPTLCNEPINWSFPFKSNEPAFKRRSTPTGIPIPTAGTNVFAPAFNTTAPPFITKPLPPVT
jgi:hypothetical protein